MRSALESTGTSDKGELSVVAELDISDLYDAIGFGGCHTATYSTVLRAVQSFASVGSSAFGRRRHAFRLANKCPRARRLQNPASSSGPRPQSRKRRPIACPDS